MPELLLPTTYTTGQETLNQKFNRKIELKMNRKGGGTILIPFGSEEEFNEILSKL